MAQPTPLGENYFLWSAGNGKPGQADILVISAHGGQKPGGFKTPKSRILFYAPDGHILLNPGLRQMVSGDLIAKEVFDPNTECPDYSLSKFQGKKHGGANESYDDVEKLLKNKAATRGHKPVDILTVRNRGNPSLWFNACLSDTIRHLQSDGYVYKEIRCSFCRSGSGHSPGFKPYNVASGRGGTYRP